MQGYLLRAIRLQTLHCAQNVMLADLLISLRNQRKVTAKLDAETKYLASMLEGKIFTGANRFDLLPQKFDGSTNVLRVFLQKAGKEVVLYKGMRMLTPMGEGEIKAIHPKEEKLVVQLPFGVLYANIRRAVCWSDKSATIDLGSDKSCISRWKRLKKRIILCDSDVQKINSVLGASRHGPDDLFDGHEVAEAMDGIATQATSATATHPLDVVPTFEKPSTETIVMPWEGTALPVAGAGPGAGPATVTTRQQTTRSSTSPLPPARPSENGHGEKDSIPSLGEKEKDVKTLVAETSRRNQGRTTASASTAAFSVPFPTPTAEEIKLSSRNILCKELTHQQRLASGGAPSLTSRGVDELLPLALAPPGICHIVQLHIEFTLCIVEQGSCPQSWKVLIPNQRVRIKYFLISLPSMAVNMYAWTPLVISPGLEALIR